MKNRCWIVFLGLTTSVIFLYASVYTIGPFHEAEMTVTRYATPDTTSVAEQCNLPHCPPVQNIVFLKTHKCASSTAQNVFMRYGDAHNLTFVLPPDGNYLGHPTKFEPSLTLSLPSSFSSNHYNIFCHHTRWDQNSIAQLMPKDTVYVSIIKDPATMYESLYNWVNLPDRYGVSLLTFLDNPGKYYNSSRVKQFSRNSMMFDFGLDLDDFENAQEIDRKIREINNRFALIMLAEYMDESLVLLKELLRWSWDDVVVFRLNARRPEFRTNLSAEYQKKARNWNHADALFYDYFAAKFRAQTVTYGDARLRKDVKKLRIITKKWYDFCVERKISRNDTDDIRFQVWHPAVSGFQLTEDGMSDPTCVRLAMAENPYTDALRRKLWPARSKLTLKFWPFVTENVSTKEGL